MTEYIIDWDTGLVIDTFSKNNLREEIVRCRDCKHYDEDIHSCDWWSAYERLAEPDGFCAWGERADNFATCKCGEDIETNGRESVTCPSCGRVITE